MYTKEEQEIVDYIEEQHPASIPNLHDEISNIKTAVKDKYTKRKAINIKVLEGDIEKLKTKALQEGMPYQTLINSILHKYVTGQMVDKSQMN